MDLLELRNELDGIDKQIVELYEKRMNVCGQVAEYKIETGKRVFDKEREKQKLEAVRALTHNDFNAYGVTELFEQIMAMSRKLQYRLLAEHDSVGKLSFSKVDHSRNHQSYKACNYSCCKKEQHGRTGDMFPVSLIKILHLYSPYLFLHKSLKSVHF